MHPRRATRCAGHIATRGGRRARTRRRAPRRAQRIAVRRARRGARGARPPARSAPSRRAPWWSSCSLLFGRGRLAEPADTADTQEDRGPRVVPEPAVGLGTGAERPLAAPARGTAVEDELLPAVDVLQPGAAGMPHPETGLDDGLDQLEGA